jgi:hypothetical protein
MINVHVTRERNRMLIAEMEDDHLTNFIMLKLRAIAAVKAACKEEPSMDEYTARLYGAKRVSVDEAADISRMEIRALYPYLAEVLMRGDSVRNTVVPALRETLGRAEGPMATGNPVALLIAGQYTGDTEL